MKNIRFLAFMLIVFIICSYPQSAALAATEGKNIYAVQLSRWNISNNGTNPKETTAGINNALQWAAKQGYPGIKLPKGIYLISKDDSVTMVSNMTFSMDKDAVLQKEANADFEYQVIFIPPYTENATITGGSVVGDRDNHIYSYDTTFKSGSINASGKAVNNSKKIISSVTFDTTVNPEFWTRGVRFKKKAGISNAATLGIYWYDAKGAFIGSVDNAQWNKSYDVPEKAKKIRLSVGQSSTAGAAVTALSGLYPTHEAGHCIYSKGAKNILIDNVRISKAIGDGVYIGAENSSMQAFSYVSGGIDDSGKLTSDTAKCRSKEAIPLNNEDILSQGRFQIVKNTSISDTQYDIYFYDASGSFLSKLTGQVFEYHVAKPEKAATCYVVINQKSPANAVSNIKSAVTSDNITISNCDLGYNRRQGSSVVGGYHISFYNNVIHDTKGIAPQSGIDVEGATFPNRFVNIQKNSFYGNTAYDVVLYDGYDSTVDGNYFSSEGAIGFSSAYARDFTVSNNAFNKSKLLGNKNGVFKDNTLTDSLASLYGPNILVDGLTLYDSQIITASKTPKGITLKNATFINTGKQSYSIYDREGNVIYENIEISGPNKLESFHSSAKSQNNVINSLFIHDYNGRYSIDLPAGVYNNCRFEYGTNTVSSKAAAIDISLNRGKYEFNNCSFKPKNSGIVANSTSSEATFKNCTFSLDSDRHAMTFFKGTNFSVSDCSFDAKSISSSRSIIQIVPQQGENKLNEVKKASFISNTFNSNTGYAISTAQAGKGAPGYVIKKNILTGCTINSKSGDIAVGNVIKND